MMAEEIIDNNDNNGICRGINNLRFYYLLTPNEQNYML